MIDVDRQPAATAQPPDRQLNISVFARRSMLSMKALRLYDRLGLLKPDSVDPDNGYRFYRESQLETARLIGLLRRLDMPLATVAAIISVAPADRHAVLATYWAETEQRHGQ